MARLDLQVFETETGKVFAKNHLEKWIELGECHIFCFVVAVVCIISFVCCVS